MNYLKNMIISLASQRNFMEDFSPITSFRAAVLRYAAESRNLVYIPVGVPTRKRKRIYSWDFTVNFFDNNSQWGSLNEYGDDSSSEDIGKCRRKSTVKQPRKHKQYKFTDEAQ